LDRPEERGIIPTSAVSLRLRVLVLARRGATARDACPEPVRCEVFGGSFIIDVTVLENMGEPTA
jgi:hypothetical protein